MVVTDWYGMFVPLVGVHFGQVPERRCVATIVGQLWPPSCSGLYCAFDVHGADVPAGWARSSVQRDCC